MSREPTGPIVCATRGGKASHILQAKAIQLARAERKSLVFVYIVNPSNLGPLSEKSQKAAQAELTWFGNALLKVAQLRAQRAGVQVETIVCEGNVRVQIEEVLREKGAGLLLVGASRQSDSTPTFKEDALTQFARQVEQDTGVEVRIISLDEA
ncbi:MAG: universal stress protein [Anaerolineales bacterium]|nr:universal stress protein [Anaerolineales bacterium]